MIKINSFKIQGFYENNNTYLKFKTDNENILLKLSQNYDYLVNLYKLWDVQYSSSLSRNDRTDKDKKISDPDELLRFQLTTKDIIKVLIEKNGPLYEILNILSNYITNFSNDEDKYNLSNNLYDNIIKEKPKISLTKIIQEIIQISDLIFPKFNKTSSKFNIKNLTAFIISSETDVELQTDDEIKLKKYIRNKLSKEDEKSYSEEFQKILEDKENENLLSFSLESEEGKKRAEIIKKELTELFDALENIKAINKIFEEFLKKNIDEGEKRTIGKGEGIVTKSFSEFDIIYLESKQKLLKQIYKYEPIIFQTITEVEESSEKDSTVFYLPNNEIELDNIQLYLDLVNDDLKYRKKSGLMSKYLRNQKNIKYSERTDQLRANKSTILAQQQRDDDSNAEKATSTVFNVLEEIKKNLDTNYNSITLLTLNDLINISNNYLNIFKSEDLLRNYIKFIKEKKKNKKESEKESKSDDELKSNFENFIKLLNKLNLQKFIWKDLYNTPLTFISPYFDFREYVSIDSEIKNYILQVDLNLQELILNNYIRYLINFISNDPVISSIKNYEYNISENIPEAKENKISLPPFLSAINKKDNCCFVLISRNDIKKFNKKNPKISNKSIFTSSQNLDSLLADIFKYNSGEKDFRLTDEMAFRKNLNLLNEIYFSPHPLENPLIKHFKKNNTIIVKGKEYTILNSKIEKMPDITKFAQKEIQKDKKKISERIYTINLTLTVLPSDVSHNFINEIEASCPDKKKNLENNYKHYINKIPLLKNLYKPKLAPKTWKIQDGRLQKREVLQGGKTVKLRKYLKKKKRTRYQKNKNKKKKKFTYKLRKIKKTLKKNKLYI